MKNRFANFLRRIAENISPSPVISLASLMDEKDVREWLDQKCADVARSSGFGGVTIALHGSHTRVRGTSATLWLYPTFDVCGHDVICAFGDTINEAVCNATTKQDAVK